MAVFCVDFAANCTTGTTNMSIQYMFMKTVSLYLAVFVYLTLFVHRANSRAPMGGSEKWTENGAHVFDWPDYIYTALI